VPAPETVSVSVCGLVAPRIVKSRCTSKVVGPICTIFFDRKVINGFLIGVEEVFALQFALLHAAPGIDAVCLNLDVQNAGRDISRRKGESGVPLVESTVYGYRSLHGEFNRAVFRRNLENRNLCSAQ